MKKKRYGKVSFSQTAKRILVGTLALSMTLSGTAWASLVQKANNAKSEILEDTKKMGDVNMDGNVNLDDVTIALKAALTIQPISGDPKTAADMNFDGDVTLDDVTMLLKVALTITTAPPWPAPEETSLPPVTTPPASTPPASTPPASTPPASTPPPKPTFFYPSTLPEVKADPANEVEGQKLEIMELDGGEAYKYYSKDEDRQISFGAVDAELPNGAELVNPFVGKTELNKKSQEMTSLEAEEGKVNCWTLSGASFAKVIDTEFDKLDRRIYDKETPEEVTYTRPQWNGVTVSFWQRADSQRFASDPIFTMSNGRLTLLVRMNGSVRFEDNADGKNLFDNSSTSTNFHHGTLGEWNYYTITIANDWIQVYVNGQENLYTSLNLARGKIQSFNDGFLTRYNTITSLTEEMIASDPRMYYVKSGAWRWIQDDWQYVSNDEYNVFGNARFRGANCGGKLIMDLLTDESTQIWAGGADTPASFTTDHVLPAGSRIAEMLYFMQELTPEQISANYAKEKESMPVEGPIYITPVPNTPEPTESSTPAPTIDPYGGSVVSVSNYNNYAELDKDTNSIVFSEATGSSLSVLKGVLLKNPFAEKSDLLSQTLESSLSGQAIFPYQDAEGKLLGSTGMGGHNDRSTQPFRGNFYDVYYGPTDVYGNDFDYYSGEKEALMPGTISEEDGKDKIKTKEELEILFADQITTYQRPIWTSGASISFWANPVEIDDSSLITFYQANNMVLKMNARGDVVFYSLLTEDWGNGTNPPAPNGKPANTFTVVGDDTMAQANQWNFYTVTIANDWIQVYVNGKEMVYSFANLSRNNTKYINKGYLSRYNTIGHWTNEMLDKYGDPSGTTADGRERNYVWKSNEYMDFSVARPLAISGPDSNSGKDELAIRSNKVYENPFATTDGLSKKTLLLDLLVGKRVQMYIGGVYTTMDEGNYTLSTVKVPKTTDPNLVNYIPEDADGDGITDQGAFCKVEKTAHTLDAGTRVSTVKSYMRELSASEAAIVYEDAANDASSPGALELAK